MTLATVRAPGKAILVGEYAVLEGAPAVSTAVNRFVEVTIGASATPATGPFVAAARTVVAKHLGAPADVALTIDSSQLYVGARKLGLGSSAAVTTATVAALITAAGRVLPDPAELFTLVDEAHQLAQVEVGSGVDVATAIAGGVLRFSRQPFSLELVALPTGLRLTFIDIGASASTPQLVATVRRWRDRDAAGYRAVIDRLAAAARDFSSAPHAAGAIAAAHDAYSGMVELGHRADAPIAIHPFVQLATLAREHGAASKPSGAGGGDLAVLFSDGDEATQQLRAAVTHAGFSILDLDANAPGVFVERQS